MNENIFDQLAGFEDEPDGMGGWLSKINKARKKVTDPIRKAVKKIAPKPLRKIITKVEAEGRRMEDSGLTKKLAIAAAGAATIWFGGPAIMAGLKTVGAGIGTAAGATKTALVGAGKLIAGAGGTINTVKSMTQGAPQRQQQPAPTQAQQALYNESLAELKAAQGLAQAMGQSPEFKQAVGQLRAQGYSDQEILAHWVESKSFYLNAVQSAQATVFPQVYDNYVSQGMPPSQAHDYATVESYEIAKVGVDEVKKQASGSIVLPVAALAALFLFK